MSGGKWLLYGANGYTGQLLAEEAVRRGHRPILAGRSAEKIRPLASRLDLELRAVSLDDRAALARALDDVDVVLHAAGPFVRTSDAMVEACLATKTSYLDITGEIPVLERTLARHEEAKEKGVVLMSGVGFDVVPTDCLARYVADQVPGATDLEIAIYALGHASAGTTKSALGQLPKGNLVRRHRMLVPAPLGSPTKRVRFPTRERTVMSIPWGDLVTAYATTGVPNITTYMAFARSQARAIRLAGPVIRRALAVPSIQRGLEHLVERTVEGPTATERERSRSYVWARAEGGGRAKEAWLDTLEGYAFTAVCGVRIVEETLAKKPVGALTPALAFGADFVLGIPTTKRWDELP